MSELTLGDVWRRHYNRQWYAANRARRRAQRLASKYQALKEWRLWLPGVT